MSELIDNRAWRVRSLKHTIRQRISSRETVGRESSATQDQPLRDDENSLRFLRQLLPACDRSEIAQAETELREEGLEPEAIRRALDPAGDLARSVKPERPVPPLAPGHPVQTFRRENRAIADHLGQLQDEAKGLPGSLARCRTLVDELLQIERHYERKETLLFPVLEASQGAHALCRLMRRHDDEAIALLGALSGRLAAGLDEDSEAATPSIREAIGRAAAAIERVLADEENILLPMALQSVTEVQWGEMWRASSRIGWCLVEPETGYAPPSREPEAVARPGPGPGPGPGAGVELEAKPEPATKGSTPPATPQPKKPGANGAGAGAGAGAGGLSLGMMPAPQAGEQPSAGALAFPSGWLTLEQLIAVFATVPVDLTFVDADDRVRFFSEGRERVFMRPRAVLGRRVQDCHPVGSIDIVERIIDDFRAGRQDVAEFWIQMRSAEERAAEPVMPGAGGSYTPTPHADPSTASDAHTGAGAPPDHAAGGGGGAGGGAGEGDDRLPDVPGRRFIHIRYFALRNEAGGYLGTLEVTQDITHQRHLQGERRLLQYAEA